MRTCWLTVAGLTESLVLAAEVPAPAAEAIEIGVQPE
jgi:hypothetical protein